MATRKNIFRTVLVLSMLAMLFGERAVQTDSLFSNGNPEPGFSFIAGSRPAADAQASYIVAVPAAASMEIPARGSIAEASVFLSAGQTFVFRFIRQLLPLPSDAGKRRLLLRVLRI